MKRWFKINIKSTVTKFMISYSLVLLLPLVISMIGYQISYNILREGIKDTNLAMINQAKDSIDNEIKAIYSTAMQIATNPEIKALVKDENRKKVKLYDDVIEVIRLLSSFKIHSTVSIMDNFYIYVKDTDYIVTPETLYRGSFYYQHMLKEDAKLFEKWKEALFQEFNPGQYKIRELQVEYIQSIPFEYDTPPKGIVVVDINKDKLTSFFTGLTEDIEKGSFMYIEGEDDQVVTFLSKDEKMPHNIDLINAESKEGFFRQKIGKENMIVVYTTSDVNGWKYVLGIPEKIAMNQLVNFQKLIIGLFVIAVLIGLMIAYYMAYKDWRPLNQLSQELREFMGEEEGASMDTFESLGGAVSTLITNNKSLLGEIKKQQPLIQAAFLQKLIKGEFITHNEINVFSESAEVDIDFNKLIIITFRIFIHNDKDSIDRDTLKELGIARIVIKDALKNHLGEKMFFYDMDHLTSVAIINADGLGDSKSEIGAILETLTGQIRKDHGIRPFFGISNECFNLLEIWRSYEESRTALNFAVKKEDVNFIWYENVDYGETQYYYPLDFEERLIQHTKAGEYGNIKTLLDILYVENFEKRQLEAATIDELYSEVISTIVKLTQSYTEAPRVEDLCTFMGKTTKEDIQLFFKKVRDMYLGINTQANEDKTCRQLKMINKIKEYIQSVYTTPDLGLSMVAGEFNISEGYLSSFFKEQTNMNFTEYVEQLRIGRACELLKDNSLTITEIGGKVGYNSVQSFRRAFKRIQGVSPSAIRKGK